MISSGHKRGLATAAISAMAITGLPFFAGTANADSLNTQVGASNVDLVTFDGNTATNTISTKNDGQNTTFRLEAAGGSNVAQVKFQYSIGANPTRTTIATVGRNDDGAFSTEWTAAGLAGANLTIYAVGLAADGTTVVDTDSDTAAVDNAADTVNITDGDAMGVFQAPYSGHTGNFVGVAGTASSNAPVDLEWYGDGSTWTADGTATPSGANHAWSRTMDITGYAFGTTDQLLVSADNGASDDTEAFTLYKQQVTTVTATPDRTTVPAGTPANITITVADQNGKPIAGAEVRTAAGTLVGYTDGNGQVATTQNGGAANNTYYYANATDSDPYEPELGDKKSDVVAIAQYNAAPTSLAANSADGAAFDADEYDPASDITVQVKDQQSNNYDTTGQSLNYYWVFTPADGGAAVRTPASGTTPQPAEAGGKFVVGPPSNSFTGDGTYDLYGALGQDAGGNGAIASSKLLTVSSGQAEIVFDQTQPQQGQIGGEITINGTLRLWAGGPGLPNRPIHVTNAGGNAMFNQDTGPDAATYDTKTDGAGKFSATLDDPNADTTPEDDTITASTAPWTHSGDTDNANASGSRDVSFIKSVTPAEVTVQQTGSRDFSNAGEKQAGELTQYTVCVYADSDPNTPGVQQQALTNQTVTVTVDHGYLTDGHATPAAAANGQVGTWDNDGQSKDVTTGSNGCSVVWTSVGRDTGFDDDGMLTQTVTAKAGTVQKSGNPQDWTSEDPLNGGSVTVDFASDDQQDSDMLPKAQAGDQYVPGQEVALVVKAFDQFGNRVGNENVALSDNTNQADFDNGVVTTDYNDEADDWAFAQGGVDQNVKGTWTAPTTTYTDTTGNNYANGQKALTDATTINWYAIDYAASTFTLESDASGAQPVGASVILTYTAVDQQGQPIVDLESGFMRTGPDQYQDGDFNSFDNTDVNGEAHYVFQGATAGTATITAIAGAIVGPTNSFSPIGDSRATTTVTFEGGGNGPQPIHVTLTSPGNNGPKDDKLDVDTATQASGATVKLFKVKKNGKKVFLEQDTLGNDGMLSFKVNDTNGDKATKYKVKVLATSLTQAAWSNIKGVR